MHSGEKNRLLSDLPPYPASAGATTQEADWAAIQYNTQARRNRRFAKGLGVVTLGVVTLAGGFINENMDYIIGSRGSLAPAAKDCEGAPEDLLQSNRHHDPALTPTAISTLSVLEHDNKNERSAAVRFQPFAGVPEEVLKDTNRPADILLVPWNFRHELDRFTMEKSGINVRVLTSEPADISVNRQNIEKIFNMSMENWHMYSDRSMNDLYYCAYQSVLVNREHTGLTIDIVVPPKPNYFIHGSHIRGFSSERKMPGTSGFNMPNLRLGPLHPFVELPHIVFVTGKSTVPWLANYKMSERLVHEFAAHQIPRLVDADPLLHPDEGFSKVAEEQLRIMYFGDSDIPTIIYPQG